MRFRPNGRSTRRCVGPRRADARHSRSVGRDPSELKSALIRSTASSSGGTIRRLDVVDRRPAGMDRDVDGGDHRSGRRRARARPPTAGRARAPGRRSRSRARGRRRAPRRSSATSCTVGLRVRVQIEAGERLVEVVGAEPGKEDPTHRRGVGGKARADGDGDRHDPPPRRDTGDVHDALAVEHRHRRRLLHRGDERLHVRHRHLRQAHRGQVGEAEVEDARAQRELAAVVVHVAELDEREQEATSGGSGEPVRRLTSLSVSRGFSPSKERITARPRSSDWTKSLPRCSATVPVSSPPACEIRTIVRRASGPWGSVTSDAALSPGGGASRCPRRARAAPPG